MGVLCVDWRETSAVELIGRWSSFSAGHSDTLTTTDLSACQMALPIAAEEAEFHFLLLQEV